MEGKTDIRGEGFQQREKRKTEPIPEQQNENSCIIERNKKGEIGTLTKGRKKLKAT